MLDPKEKDPHAVTAANPLVRVYNKRGATLTHGQYSALAASFGDVPKSVADMWITNFPKQVLLGSDAAAELGGANARISELQGKLDDANSQIASLKADPGAKQAVKDLIEAKAQIADLESKVEALTEQLSTRKAGAESI